MVVKHTAVCIAIVLPVHIYGSDSMLADVHGSTEFSSLTRMFLRLDRTRGNSPLPRNLSSRFTLHPPRNASLWGNSLSHHLGPSTTPFPHHPYLSPYQLRQLPTIRLSAIRDALFPLFISTLGLPAAHHDSAMYVAPVPPTLLILAPRAITFDDTLGALLIGERVCLLFHRHS